MTATTTYQTIVIVGRTDHTDADHDSTCNRCGIQTRRAIVADVEGHRASLCPTCTAMLIAGSNDLYTANRLWNRAHAIETKRRTDHTYYGQRAAQWTALAEAPVELLRQAVREQVSRSVSELDEALLRAAVRQMARDFEVQAEARSLRPTPRDVLTA